MKPLFIIVALALSTTTLVAAPAAAPKAPFACTAQSGVCHFHIFYATGRGRTFRLPAGTKESVPDVRVGTDRYCVQVNKNPAYNKCARKIVSANSNS